MSVAAVEIQLHLLPHCPLKEIISGKPYAEAQRLLFHANSLPAGDAKRQPACIVFTQ